MLLALDAAIPKRHWNARCAEITDSVLLNFRTQKEFCCALIIIWGKKERKTTVLENASLKNYEYDGTEVYLSMTSQQYQCLTILFPFLSFVVCIIRKRFGAMKI